MGPKDDAGERERESGARGREEIRQDDIVGVCRECAGDELRGNFQLLLRLLCFHHFIFILLHIFIPSYRLSHSAVVSYKYNFFVCALGVLSPAACFKTRVCGAHKK